MTINAFMREPIRKLGDYYDIHVILNGSAADISPGLELARVIPVRIERRIAPWRDLLALWKIWRIFREGDFDAVQSVTPKAGLLAMLAAFLAGIKVRIHIFTGQVWVTRRGIGRRILKFMDRIIAMLATEVLVDSISQRRFLLDQGVVGSDKSSVLAQGSIAGVDTGRFRYDAAVRSNYRARLGAAENDTLFMYIGRLNRDKGVLDLARAFARFSGSPVRLVLVGPDESGIRAEMESILDGCLERVRFAGFSGEPEKYMSAADVVCLPSYREGFGSVLLEAAAVGVPAIGSRIYGVEDAIVDGRTGVLFEAGNVDALYRCMRSLADDRAFTSKLGESARRRAIDEFDSDILATAWLDYFKARM